MARQGVVLTSRRLGSKTKWAEAKRDVIRAQLADRFPDVLAGKTGDEVPTFLAPASPSGQPIRAQGDWIVIRFPVSPRMVEPHQRVSAELAAIDRWWKAVFAMRRPGERGLADY